MKAEILRILKLFPEGFQPDWTMAFTDQETGECYTTDGIHDPNAEREEAQVYWEEVAASIEQALVYETKARRLLEQGDVQAAEKYLVLASKEEHPSGGGGTYDFILRELRTLIDRCQEYEATLAWGSESNDCIILALTEDDAWERAIAWTKKAEWPPEGVRVRLRLSLLTDNDEFEECGERWIEIPPNIDQLDEYSDLHAQSAHSHKWESPHELVGGAESNPGVWSNGGRSYTYHEVCCCGAHKHTYYDPERLPMEEPRTLIEITYPDGLWPWGEDCTRPGKSE